MRILYIVLTAALSSLGSHPAQAQASPSAQYRGLQTLDIPFANGPIAMDHVPHVWLKLRGSRPVRFVEVVHDHGVFVNTGRMFLEGFDYLYDAAGGYVGFGWNGRLSGGYGGMTPDLSYAP
jgi:hypothetical protein